MITKKLTKKLKGKKGFTMMELIIVVAIIAILLALLAPNLTKFLGTSKTTAREANAKTVYTSVSAWLADLATEEIPVKAGTVNISGGTITQTNILETGDEGKLNDLKEYIDGNKIKSATVVVNVKADYSATDVSYAEGGETVHYPRKAKTE